MSRRRPVDEQRLRVLFEEIDAPATLDRWRERALPAPVVRPRVRMIAAVAAAFAVVVGMAGIIVANQIFADPPPATPPMIIDGPDAESTPPSVDRSVLSSAPPSRTGAKPPARSPDTGGGSHRDGRVDGGVIPTPADRPAGGPAEVEPAPMVGFPTMTNAGVPPGDTQRDHQGDLHITEPGTVVSGLRVSGTVVVDAPDVTLRRVTVLGGGTAVRQTARAPRLTIELSDLSGRVVQEAGGLTIRRCTATGVDGSANLSIVDTYFSFSVRIAAGSTRVTLRHNTVEGVELADVPSPIRDVTIENNSIGHLNAPTQPGSSGIRVLRNEFRSNPPSTGWNAEGPGNQWAGNTDQATGAPIGP